MPTYLHSLLSEVLERPERIRASVRFENARLFSSFYPNLFGGKHIVIVVVTDPTEERHWIITAYLTRRLTSRHQNA